MDSKRLLLLCRRRRRPLLCFVRLIFILKFMCARRIFVCPAGGNKIDTVSNTVFYVYIFTSSTADDVDILGWNYQCESLHVINVL